MATVDASIPLSIKKPDTTGKLSELMNMQRQAIAVKADRTALESAQQTQRQRKGLADFDVQPYIGDDGTIDLNRIAGSEELRKAAGDQFPDVLQQYAGVRQQQLAAKSSLVKLRGEERTAFAEMVGALRSDERVAKDTDEGRKVVADAATQFLSMYPESEAVLRAYAAPIVNAPKGKLPQVLQNIQLQATSADNQASRQAPEYANTGDKLQQTNPYAQTGQTPDSIPLTISPGEQSSVMTDQLQNPFEVRRDPRGNITQAKPLEGPARFGAGEKMTIEQQAEQNFANVNANRIAAQLAPQQLDQINKALEISKDVTTGGGAEWATKRAKWESIAGGFIPGLKDAADDATKLQLLDKYAERIAADSARVLGANASTDAARESITRQNANIGYTPKAIQNVLQYAKAQTQAMAAKGDAQEAWLKSEGNGITKQHEFETKWRQAYDPRVFQLEAMDDNAQDEYVKKLSTTQKVELKTKLKALRELGAMK